MDREDDTRKIKKKEEIKIQKEKEDEDNDDLEDFDEEDWGDKDIFNEDQMNEEKNEWVSDWDKEKKDDFINELSKIIINDIKKN